MTTTSEIRCPKCNTPIDVQDALTQQLQSELEEKFKSRLEQQQESFIKEQTALQQAKSEFEALKRKENQLFQERLDVKLAAEKTALEEKIREKLLQDQQTLFQSMQKELNEKSTQLRELNTMRAEMEKLKREKEEIKSATEAAAQQRINALLAAESAKIRKTEEERNELKLKELQKQLDDQKKLTEEMKRRQEQGSVQLQGEVQELAIEAWLRTHFPLDHIEEIKKGARGGDCIQVVNTREHANCGTIYYESKRTKEFNMGWIEKFKSDMRNRDANLGVLVTETMPSGQEHIGLVDGVWVCTYEEFKGLCTVLRESVIQIHMTTRSQENKGDKMHMLYDFLTSTTFRMQVESIVEGFSSMKESLESEKRAMFRIWKEREKQIDKVIINTIEMHASIKGIAGNAIQPVKALELVRDESESDMDESPS